MVLTKCPHWTRLLAVPKGVIHLFGSRMICVAFNQTWLKEGKPWQGNAAP